MAGPSALALAVPRSRQRKNSLNGGSASRQAGPVGSIMWDHDIAEVYDAVYAAKFDEAVLRTMVDLLAELAGDGPALEFAVGTGRVALPLSKRGIPVSAIELSPHMADRMRAKPGADAVPVTIGDMTTTRVPGTFALVYLVANTIMNVTTQDEQVSVFANAAAHLHPGGCFVVELIVPQLRAVPRGEPGRVFTLDADHVGIETFDDLVGQIAWSHHWMEAALPTASTAQAGQARTVPPSRQRFGAVAPWTIISWARALSTMSRTELSLLRLPVLGGE